MKAAALIVASTVGLYISIYFTLIYYSFISPASKLVPEVCRVEESTCRSVLSHRDARILGIPNSLVGAMYYMLVLIVAIVHPAQEVLSWVMYASWATVVVSIYLVYSLLFVVRTPCLLCFVSHGLNLLLAILLTMKVL